LDLPVLGRRELLEPLPIGGQLVELLPMEPLGKLQVGVPVEISCCLPRTLMSENQFG
jgi:hypothetical protein